MAMMITSLLMRAWIIQMKWITAVGDLQLLFTGPNQFKLFENGFAKTHEHLEILV